MFEDIYNENENKTELYCDGDKITATMITNPGLTKFKFCINPDPEEFITMKIRHFEKQIDKLANFFLKKHCDKIRAGSAVDNAIRLIDEQAARIKELEDYLKEPREK